MEALTEFQASQLARALADTGDYLLAAQVDLYQDPIAILPNTPLATFTDAIATYTGYAPAVVVWEAPSLDSSGNVQVIGSVGEFRPTGTTVGNQIYGVFITADVGGALLFAGPVDGAPVPMLSTLNRLQVQIIFRPALNSLTLSYV